MYKVAILGCENSHANNFLDAVLVKKLVDDVEFVGVYSDDRAAAEKLREKYGVPVADSYDAFVGKVDGIMITARHGDNHYQYAKPYIASGIPMFIDKPITCSEEEAKVFKAELKAAGIRISGGSICVLDKQVQALKNALQAGEHGKALGGFLRAPVNLNNPYGDFYFYCQHLVQVMMEIFGNYPVSVRAVQKGNVVTCIVRYEECDVTLQFVDGNYLYYAAVSFEKEVVGGAYDLAGCSDEEFMHYHDLLTGKSAGAEYDGFFAPVYVFNAIKRAMESGAEESVHAVR
jgi:predicted dehydrogenase